LPVNVPMTLRFNRKRHPEHHWLRRA
jgi:hypothetical protein